MYELEVNGKKHNVFTKEHFEDFLRDCGDEVFEAYQGLVEDNVRNLRQELELTEHLRNRWEVIADGYYNQLSSISVMCSEFQDDINKSKRLDRKKINKWIDTIASETQQ